MTNLEVEILKIEVEGGNSIQDTIDNNLIIIHSIFKKYKVNGSEILYKTIVNYKADYIEIKVRADVGAYDFKVNFNVLYTVNIQKTLKKEMATCLSTLYNSCLAVYYVGELNKVLLNICKSCDCTLQFSLDKTTVSEIENNRLVIGLTLDKALSIPRLLFYDQFNSSFYTKTVYSEIKLCQTAAQLLKAKLQIYTDLGIYNSSKLEILIRNRYTRKYKYMGVSSVGYILTDNQIALITNKRGCLEEQLSPIDLDTLLFSDEKVILEVV